MDENGLPAIIYTDSLAAIFGISPRRLHQLITDNRIPAECNFSGDKWRTFMTLREVAGYYRRQADQKRPQSAHLIEAQSTLEDLRAKRLKNAKMARELLPYKIMAQDVGEIISGVKTRFINFPDKMAQRIFRAKDKVEVAEMLDKEIRDIWGAFEDPKFMEDIAAKVHDDEFEQSTETDHNARDPSGGSADMVKADP